MTDIVPVGHFVAIVYRAYRRNTSFLTRKVGEPINAAAEDLWILCASEEDAQRILTYGRVTLNEYVTNARRPSYAAVMANVPSDVAVMFSSTTDLDDDGHMRRSHPVPQGLSARYRWEKGSYLLDVETTKDGAYVTDSVKIAPGDLAPDVFVERLDAVVKRCLRKMPAPFDDHATPHVSQAASLLLARLTAPGAAMFRHWFKGIGDAAARDGTTSLKLTGAAFGGLPGIASVQFDAPARSNRIRSWLYYQDDSVMYDLGMTLRTPLPETAVLGIVGEALNQVVDADCTGPWPIQSVAHVAAGTFVGVTMPTVELTPPLGLDPLAPQVADRKLVDMLTLDLFDLHNVATRLKADGKSAPCRLRGDTATIHMLASLGAETAAFLLAESLHPSNGGMVDLTPWLGQGAMLNRKGAEVRISGTGTGDMCQSSLMPRIVQAGGNRHTGDHE